MKLSERFWLAVGIVAFIGGNYILWFVPFLDPVEEGLFFVNLIVTLIGVVSLIVDVALAVLFGFYLHEVLIPEFNEWLDKMDK